MVITRSEKISNEKEEKSNLKDESLLEDGKQVAITDKRTKSKKKPSERNSNLKKVRRQKKSDNDTSKQAIGGKSKENNSEENGYSTEKFVPDFRTADDLSIDQINQIVNSPGFKEATKHLVTSASPDGQYVDQVDYESDSDLEERAESEWATQKNDTAITAYSKYVQPIINNRETVVSHSDNESSRDDTQSVRNTKDIDPKEHWEQEICDKGFRKFYTNNPDSQLNDSQIIEIKRGFLAKAYGHMVNGGRGSPSIPPSRSAFRGFGGGTVYTKILLTSTQQSC